MQIFQILRKNGLLVLTAVLGVFLASCQEKISSIGASYLKDTITSGIHVYSDSTVLTFAPIVKQVAYNSIGLSYALNRNASAMMIGQVSGDVQSWIAMKMPILTADSVGAIVNDSLQLRM